MYKRYAIPEHLKSIVKINKKFLKQAGFRESTIKKIRRSRKIDLRIERKLEWIYDNYWYERLTANGMRDNEALDKIEYLHPKEIISEINARRKIAEFIARNKDTNIIHGKLVHCSKDRNGYYRSPQQVLDGMNRSNNYYTLDDWVQYVKNTYKVSKLPSVKFNFMNED